MIDNTKHLVGDAFIDSIITGGIKQNPNYNPNTKKGKLQPRNIIDTSSTRFDDGLATLYAEQSKHLRYTGKELGLTNEEIERNAKRGISLSPYNTDDDITKALADSQSAGEQILNMFMQGGIGEVVLGSLEGFGDIVDGIINSFTGDDFYQNPYSQFMHEAKENFTKKFEIYRENPNDSFDLSDLGWWTSNAVSVMTTASLMLPAAGWARALGMLGKISRLNKLGRWATKGVSRGIAKAATKMAGNSGEFSALRGIAGKSARIEQAIKGWGGITTQAVLSRAGEGMMEAKGVYDDVYSRSVENLNNMPDDEFAKFIANNPKFDGMSKEDVAKAIAGESANKTLTNDWWMLLMDIPQYKALGSLFGKTMARAPKASARIAAKNVRRTMAGKPAEQLIKDNIWNRTKENFKYALKNPKDSFMVLELGEGFEEMYQGIQTEKGMEVATNYFDPTFTPRTLQSYLQDGSIWEQGFWGAIGGIMFPKIGDAVRKGSRRVEGMYKKKHMTSEDYEAWKRSENEIAKNEINDVVNRTNKFIEDIQTINSGRNPYNFTKDPSTGKIIFKDGNIVEETIDETQKQLLREEAIKRFYADDTMQSIDSGTYDLKREIFTSPEFDKYLTDKGVQITSTDKALSQQVADYMDNVAALYKTELQNINALVDTTNPFIERVAARNITRNKLQVDEYNNTIANIESQISSQNTNNTDYTAYKEKVIYNAVQQQLRDIENKERIINLRRANNDIGESAAQQQIKILNAERAKLLEYVTANSTDGALDAVRKTLKEEKIIESTKEFDDFVKDYKQALLDNTRQEPTAPPATISNLVQQLAETGVQRSYTEAQIPATQNEYVELYDEFARGMDVMEQNRTKDYLDVVKNYLASADNVEDAINNLYNETIENEKVKEALRYLRYRFFDETADALQGKGQFLINMAVDDIINTERQKRKDAERLAQEAKEEGIELPPAGTETDTDTETETDNGIPSTGEETETDTTETTDAVNPGPTVVPIASEPTPTVAPESQSNESTTNNVDDGASNPFDESNTPEDVLDGTYENPRLKADIDARDYVIHIGFNNPTKLDEITNALQNNDSAKLAEFVKEVTDYLLQAGYDEATSKSVAKSAIVNTINMYGGLNQKSAFGRLAQQMAINFKKHLKNKKADTPLLTDEQVNEIVDKFLEEYANVSNNPKLSDGRQVINLQSLFNYLITAEGIDINTAVYIYNNLSQYIATNTGEKYLFTGFSTTNGRMMSGKEFVDELEESKAQILSARDQMHIFPIPIKERGKRYRQALLDAANGAPTTIIPSYKTEKIPYTDRDGTIKYHEEKKMTHLEVHVLKNKGDKSGVKIGILRTVKWNSDGTKCLPISHYSGFGNRMTVNTDDTITLDNGRLFEALIDRADAESQQLFNDIVDYSIKIRQITDRLDSGVINEEQAAKEYVAAMTDEIAKRINNNKYIKQLLDSQAYKFTEEQNTDKKKAANLAGSISAILFYSDGIEFHDAIHSHVNSFAIDANSMRERYETYKSMVRDNYEHTFDLQDALANSEDMTARIKINVSYYTKLNTGQDKNIGDSAFQHDPTQKDYTPLIMVKNGHMIGEDGKDYGKADPNIADYSMGYIVHNDEKSGVKYVAYFKNAVDLRQSELKKHVADHFVYLIQKQLTNINNATHADTFNEVRDALEELFGAGGLFRFGSHFSTGDLFVSPSRDGRYITLQNYDRVTKRVRKIMTFYSTNANGGQSHAIAIYDQNGENPVYINSLTGNSKMTEEQVRGWLNYAHGEVFKTFQLNRSSVGHSKQTRSGGTPKLFTYSKEGGFILHLAGKDYKYNNYGDFLTAEKGFTTNVYSDENGNFTTLEMNNRSITMDTKVQENSGAATNTDVSDYLFDKNYKTVTDKKTGEKKQQLVRKTVDTTTLLSLAGVDQNAASILMGRRNDVKIATDKIQIYENEDVDGYLFFNPKDKKIYITKKGAQALNGNPANAVRLILHENIHRHFNSNKFTNAERERIVKELRQVYDFVRTKLTENYNNGNVNKAFYDSAIAVLDVTQSYEDEQTRIEEFLVECLTQKEFTEWLNNTEYGADADITNINKKKKSILQKIMDVLLDLLGIKERNIKNNSILAREYVILSKEGLTTINSGLDRQSNTATTDTAGIAPVTSPVEGTKQPTQPINIPTPTTTQKNDTVSKIFDEPIVIPPGYASNETIEKIRNFANKYANESKNPITIEDNDIKIVIEDDSNEINSGYGKVAKAGIVPIGATRRLEIKNNPYHSGVLRGSTISDNNDGSYTFKGNIIYDNRGVIHTPVKVAISGKLLNDYIEANKELNNTRARLHAEGRKDIEDYTKGMNAHTATIFTALNRKIIDIINNSKTESTPATQTTTINNATLDATANKIQEIRDTFDARITRSENFAQDHTYYLDGKKVDTSVTQVIHGKQDLGAWGTPASLLGNTFDEAARTYFINHGVMPEDAKIPNVTEEERKELIEDLERLRQHLDKVHGKDKWRAISEEFPIGGTVTVDGEVKTVAGTMDLLIYTDSGDIYVYDFKTKRKDITKRNFNPEVDGNIDENTLTGYREQVNIYVQLLEQNFPELRGRVHTGSLIKSNPNYPAPNDRIKYRESPTEKNQLQVSVNGKEFVNIQDAGLWDAYDYPRLPENLDDKRNIIPVEYKEYKHPIGAMPDNAGPVESVNDNIETQKDADDITAGLDDTGSYLSDDEMTDTIDLDDVSWAKTEQISDVTSSVEIYAPAIKDGATDNAFGVRVVNNMNDFIQGFPVQHQAIVKQLLASNEINYVC